MDHSKEAAVRARAYQLWVEGGYADGYQDQHWRQAEREIIGPNGGTPAASHATEPAQDAAAGAGAAPIEGRRWAGLHSDGMSLHPSVLDPGPGRQAA